MDKENKGQRRKTTMGNALCVAATLHENARVQELVAKALLATRKQLVEGNTSQAIRALDLASQVCMVGGSCVKRGAGHLGSGAVTTAFRKRTMNALKKDGTRKDRLALAQMKDYVNRGGAALCLADTAGTTNSATGHKRTSRLPNHAAKHRRTPKAGTPVPMVPAPANGTEYAPREAGMILAGLKSGINAVMRHWVDKKLVPCKRGRLLGLRKATLKNKFVQSTWGVNGRPITYLDVDEIDAVYEKFSLNGESIPFDKMSDAMYERACERAKERGLEVKDVCRPCAKSVNEALAISALNKDSFISKSAVARNETRFIAEHSVIAAASNGATAAVSNYYLADPAGAPGDCSDEIGKMLSRANGGGTFLPKDPALITSTDDSKRFVYPHRLNDNHTVGAVKWAVASRSQSETGSRATFDRKKKQSFKNGVTVTETMTITAGGFMAPTWLVVECKEEWLPTLECPSGLEIVKIEGLSYGCSIDPTAGGAGFLVFARCGKDANGFSIKRKIATEYHKRVYIPLIDEIRRKKGYTGTETEVPIEFSSSGWRDGADSMVNSITDPTIMAREVARRSSHSKHDRAGSLARQPGDLLPWFRESKQMEDTYVPTGTANTIILQTVRAALKHLRAQGTLLLPARIFEAVTDYAARFPHMLASKITTDKIQGAFVRAGFLDNETRRHLSLDGLRRTCRRKLSEDETAHWNATFIRLLKPMLDFGYIPLQTYIDLGYEPERDKHVRSYLHFHSQNQLPNNIHLPHLMCHRDGNVVTRDAGITNEPHQFAKVLTAEPQRELRAQEQAKVLQKRISEVALLAEKTKKILSVNTMAEEKLKLFLPPLRQGLRFSNRSFASLKLEHFMKLTRPELGAFVHTRIFSTFKPTTKLPKKGSLKDATEACAGQGERTLVSMAFESRTRSLRLKQPEVPDRLPDGPAPLAPSVLEVVVGQTDMIDIATFKSSELLADASWAERVQRHVKGRSPDVAFKFDCGPKADKLQSLIGPRLKAHCRSRNLPSEKRDHPALRFFAENVAHLAAIATAFGHVIRDVDCQSVTPLSSSLLAPSSSFNKVEGVARAYGGGYVHANVVRADWNIIRAGSAVVLGERGDTHRKCAELRNLDDLKSLFYTSYPIEGCENSNDQIRRGYFGDLVQPVLVALAFDKTDKDAINAICSPSKTIGIFCWSKATLDYVSKIKFRGLNTLKSKQLRMIAYAIELFYDLLIDPKHNVSRSFGFETCLGLFGDAAAAQ